MTMSVQARDQVRTCQAIGSGALSSTTVLAGLAVLIAVLIAAVVGISLDINPVEIGGPPYP